MKYEGDIPIQISYMSLTPEFADSEIIVFQDFDGEYITTCPITERYIAFGTNCTLFSVYVYRLVGFTMSIKRIGGQ